MAHKGRKKPPTVKWPNGFPDGPTRTGRRQNTKSRLGKRKIVKKR